MNLALNLIILRIKRETGRGFQNNCQLTKAIQNFSYFLEKSDTKFRNNTYQQETL